MLPPPALSMGKKQLTELEDQVDISNNSNINNTKADKNPSERDLTDAIDRKCPPKKDRFFPPPGIAKVKRGKIVRKQAKSPVGKMAEILSRQHGR